MSGLACVRVWALLIHAQSVLSAFQFLAREKGGSVVLACRVQQTTPPPIGVYLKRSWLRPKEVLFKYEGSEVSVKDSGLKNRTSVSGDPSVHALNVTVSDLQPSDTDRYYCEFILHNERSEDIVQRGDHEFVLFVTGVADVNRDLVETCVGSSVTLPCIPPVGDSSAVEGVVLKRQRGQQPMELLYHSKDTAERSELSMGRFELKPAPGPGGISYSLTVGALQPEDSGLYSCQLLLHGRTHSSSMGQQGTYVSVQGDKCGCSSYSTLIYALSAAVAVTFVLLLMVVVMQRGKRRRVTATHTPAPIYEEMTGLQSKNLSRSRSGLESEYTNVSPGKPSPENHYESPNRALSPKFE